MVEAGHTRKTNNMIYGLALGHAGSVNLEIEINHADNQSIMPVMEP